MIHIANFDAEFNGRTFKDRSLGMQSDLTCIGYGDNQGNPYFVGVYPDNATNTLHTKTVLMKNAEFQPKP